MDEEQVRLVRDHSHARSLYRLWRALDEENDDNIYTDEERLLIRRVVLLLSRKENELKDKHPSDEWCKFGNYQLFG